MIFYQEVFEEILKDRKKVGSRFLRQSQAVVVYFQIPPI